jgi:hypothetical protein
VLSVQSAIRAANDLYTPGYEANLKYALWAASLSPQKRLSYNILQAEALLPYIDRPLPQNNEAVFNLIRSAHPFVSHSNAKYILAIEAAERDGRLDELSHMPTTYHDWLAWRLAVVSQFKGISFKAASFVALLMWPLDCPLIPVDSHVVARLGLPKSMYLASSKSYKVYRLIEKMVLHEWYKSGYRHLVSPAVWHWYKWSEWRQATGDEPISDECESHCGLSPYVIPEALPQAA